MSMNSGPYPGPSESLLPSWPVLSVQEGSECVTTLLVAAGGQWPSEPPDPSPEIAMHGEDSQSCSGSGLADSGEGRGEDLTAVVNLRSSLKMY